MNRTLLHASRHAENLLQARVVADIFCQCVPARSYGIWSRLRSSQPAKRSVRIILCSRQLNTQVVKTPETEYKKRKPFPLLEGETPPARLRRKEMQEEKSRRRKDIRRAVAVQAYQPRSAKEA